MKISMSYKKLRLTDFLESGEYHSVLFKFYHGLGDAISFYCNVLPVLEKKFPDVDFYFETERGQEMMFGNVCGDEDDYDLSVFVNFPCSEWDIDTDETKAEKCLRVEMGIDGVKQGEDYQMPCQFMSPLIGCHFFSTSCEALSCDYEIAQAVWDGIANHGMIPIDTHFVHPNATIKLAPFDFEACRNVADVKPDVGLLFGLLGTLSGFVGVAGGNFWAALSCLPPQHILFIENEFPVTKLTRLPVFSMRGFEPDVFDEFMRTVKSMKYLPTRR